MPAILLDGTRIATEIKAEVAAEAKSLLAAGVRPGLAAVLVGNNPASEIYVRNKVRACEALGFFSEHIVLSDSSNTTDVLGVVQRLNSRDEIDGILVQLPLPKGVDSRRVLLAVNPAKDVDGFHPFNVGNLSGNHPTLVACTPAGVMEILRRCNIAMEGREAVVVGRSDIVGKPMALLLLHENATVTICHSKTPDLAAVCREGEILVAAIGRGAMITADYIRPGATVIDVGMNRLNTRPEIERLFPAGRPGAADKLAAFDKKGTLLVGDVHPLYVAERAGAYTPVPGGVGPLTIAMLMVNTIGSAERRMGVRDAAVC